MKINPFPPQNPDRIGTSQQTDSSSANTRSNSAGASAPQQQSPFSRLPDEIQMKIAKALHDRDRFNFALAGKVTHFAAQDSLRNSRASQQATDQIKTMPIDNINDFNNALNIAENVNDQFKHGPMQAIADRLIFLPREISDTGKQAFMNKARSFISEGNEIDEAIKFFDWSRSLPTVDQPNHEDFTIPMVKNVIESKMRGGLTAKQALEQALEQALKLTESSCSFNIHDMDLLLQHAKGIEIHGFPAYVPTEY